MKNNLFSKILSFSRTSGGDLPEGWAIERGGHMPTKRIGITVLIVGAMVVQASNYAFLASPVEPSSGSAASAMYRLGRELPLSPSPQCDTSDEHTPAVAYNYLHKEYLVVWSNEWSGGSRDIYARRVSESGQVLSWFCVTTSANKQLRPSITYNAVNDQYLVVWMQESGSNVYEIWGRIIPWNAPGASPDFQIISWTNRSFWGPRVAWNSNRNEYLVVWNALDTTTSFPPGVPSDIAGYRVSAGGVVQNPGWPLILTTYSSPHQVDMVYNPAMDEYFLAFVVIQPQATTGNDIYGLRVGCNGTPVNPPSLIHIAEIANNQDAPAVATNEQNRYMVVWQHEYSATDHDIYGREYHADGTPVGSYFSVASWTEDTTVPDIAANGANNEWLAVWQQALGSGSGYAIKGFRWGSGPAVYTYFFEVANWAFVESKNPAVAADIPGYFIAYEEMVPPGKFDIYGRMWWPEVCYLPLVLKN
jgi:hypothetical protein